MNELVTNEPAQIDLSHSIGKPAGVSHPGSETILTCPGHDNRIRWRPGERLDHLFQERCRQLEQDGLADHLAISADGADISYAALDYKADQLSRYLIKQGVRPSDRVGLLLPKSAWAYIAMLAVMRVNAVYVPLDASFPEERLSFIATDANIKLVLTLARHRELLEATSAAVVCLDAEQIAIDGEDGSRFDALEPTGSADQLCYIIYTSGSTGRPKGVAIAHSSICNFVRVAAEIYGLRKEDRVYQGMTIAFDFSVEEIWVPLLSGATLIPAPPGASLVGKDLSDFLGTKAVTALCCVPTLLATIDDELPALRFLLVSGEACPQNLVARWHKPGRTFLNVYGPTEATVTATWTALHPQKPVTIGVPLPTYSVIILDEAEDRALPRGAVGEIGIAGICLADGYVNRPDLTRRSFIADFLHIDNNPSRRIYRTGDLGRVTEEGEIEYLGRIDTQVKIRGYRIELTEIESILMTVPGIAQAVVNTYEPTPGMVELVAYYTMRQDAGPLEQDEIVGRIRDHLPSYMLPRFFEEMPILPMLPSGKVDRKSLPAPLGPRYLAERAHFVAPENDMEREVARILAELLGFERVSADAHFFDELGSNSLLMAQLCARIREGLRISGISMKDVYLHPSVRELSSFLITLAREEQPATRNEAIHIATNAQYYACGVLQALFYCGYMSAIVVLVVEGYGWISSAVGPVEGYLRSAALGAGAFLTAALLPIALKWLLVGKWRRDRIPVWSLRYFRFWVVKLLVQSDPMILFVGSPLYSVYLRLLGARIGRNVAIFSTTVPVCTDLISIGADSVIRKDSVYVGYAARSGYIETGPVSIGENAFVGEAAVLDIDTAIGNDAQLGHSSSLQRNQSVPSGKRYHGSPAQETQANYCPIASRECSPFRRVSFSVAQLLALFGLNLPLPIFVGEALFSSLSLESETDLSGHAGSDIRELVLDSTLLVISLLTFFGVLMGELSLILIAPYILNFLIKAGETYVLYGIRFFIFRRISGLSNSRTFNIIFGDSAYIIYYLRAVGYHLSLSYQTGSNFGLRQKHESPFLSDIGKGTLVSDGLSMLNAHISSSSFMLSRVSIGANNFLGNLIFYPPDGKTGSNCLLATKVLVPIDGPVRQDVGILGSPCFEIPRSVLRDKQFDHYKEPATLKDRLFRKKVSNTITIGMYLATHFAHFYIVILLLTFMANQYDTLGWLTVPVSVMAVPVLTIAYFVLIERASLGFSRLQPRFCSIYDEYYWRHERYWKLAEWPYIGLFNGTPFKNLIWRLLGVRLGKKLFDDGGSITEKTLVEIGDHCTLNQMSSLQSHSLEDGTFKSDHIRIGNGCTIGCNALVHYGVNMGDNVVLGPDSFLMKGESPVPNSAWSGNPAKQT